MKDLNLPLTDQELDILDELLLDRVPEDEVAEDSDEGILDISTLDGFMTAVVSSPNPILPSTWVPAVWGDFAPKWQSEAHFSQIMAFMMRHMNSIVNALINAPEEFEPLFMEREVDGKTYLIVDEWCAGYLRGIALDQTGWKQVADFDVLIDPILLFAAESGWGKLEKMTEEEVVQHQCRIAPSVRQLHAYWLEKRKSTLPTKSLGPKVGRNVLCPCGSGEKFKKCCGSAKALH